MKKVLIFSLIGMLLLQSAPVYAAELDNDISSKLSGETLDAVFSDMKTNLENGEEISFSESLDKVGGLYISPDFKYDLSDTSLDMNNLDASLTNLGFSKLTTSLAGSFNNMDLSGNALGCQELFHSQFEGMNLSLDTETYKIPNGFNPDTMLENSKQSLQSAYSNVIHTESFKGIKDSISIGSIFESAKAGVKQHSLTSIDSLKQQLGMDSEASITHKYEEQEHELDLKIHNEELEDYQDKAIAFFEKDADFLTLQTQISQEKDEIQNDGVSQPLEIWEDGMREIRDFKSFLGNSIIDSVGTFVEEKATDWWDGFINKYGGILTE